MFSQLFPPIFLTTVTTQSELRPQDEDHVHIQRALDVAASKMEHEELPAQKATTYSRIDDVMRAIVSHMES